MNEKLVFHEIIWKKNFTVYPSLYNIYFSKKELLNREYYNYVKETLKIASVSKNSRSLYKFWLNIFKTLFYHQDKLSHESFAYRTLKRKVGWIFPE